MDINKKNIKMEEEICQLKETINALQSEKVKLLDLHLYQMKKILSEEIERKKESLRLVNSRIKDLEQ